MCRSSLLILMLILVAPLTTTVSIEEGEAPIKWVRYIDPTDKDDYVRGTCIFRGYIAVVGYIVYTLSLANITLHPYIVLIDRGEIVREWIGEEIGGFVNCVSIEDKLYVVGWSARGAIYVFDEDLNIVKTANSMNNYTGYTSIIYDGSYIYIGGQTLYRDIDGDGYGEEIWVVEKRTIDLDLVSSREIYLSPWKFGLLTDIDVNPVVGDIWAVGLYAAYINYTPILHSLIAILNNNLSNVKLIDYPMKHENFLSNLNDVCFDSNGYTYIAGDYGVAKFDPYGNLVTVNKNLEDSHKILCINNSIYVFRDPYIDGYYRHVLTVLDRDLNIVNEYVLNRDVDAHSHFDMGRASFDGENIYVAGVDEALGRDNKRIVIYSIAIEPLQPPTPVETIVETSTITTTIATTTTPVTIATTTTQTTMTTTIPTESTPATTATIITSPITITMTSSPMITTTTTTTTQTLYTATPTTSTTVERTTSIQPSTSIATPYTSIAIQPSTISTTPTIQSPITTVQISTPTPALPTTPQTTTQGTQTTGLQLYIALIVVGAVAVMIIAMLILKK